MGWNYINSVAANSKPTYYNKNKFVVITMWRLYELFLCRDISRVHKMSEISPYSDHHEHVFMPYY